LTYVDQMLSTFPYQYIQSDKLTLVDNVNS